MHKVFRYRKSRVSWLQKLISQVPTHLRSAEYPLIVTYLVITALSHRSRHVKDAVILTSGNL